MTTLAKWLVVVLAVAGAGVAAYRPAMTYWANRNKITWKTAAVEQGKMVAVVNSTGTVKPKQEVIIGSFVSGPVKELHGEFNQEVKKGDLLARIDPRLFEAAVSRDRAMLANQEADVLRVQAQLQLAINDEKRANDLRARSESFITQADSDKFKFSRMSLEAQLQVAQTMVDQAKAGLDSSLANLNYTDIRAPVDGVIINRKIDAGQTVAAQFQTPELFTIAPDMREEIRVHASVDEADIGQIKHAQVKNYPVTFTVDAYPEKLFTGKIIEIRLNSTTTQNVVTYPVIVAAPNPDLELLPGMTANLSFQVDERDDVVKIPNAALRFFPTVKQVRPKDVPILEGRVAYSEDESHQSVESLSVTELSRLRKARAKRHVWTLDGALLRAIEVTTGLSDGEFTELVQGELKTGEQLVTGARAAATGFSQ